ncbi:hypothetical protein HanOQP8_Chr00c740g0852151 [Helianthus annuus]|nr:hypothetical protein HanLR1_Chr00c2604g0849941 [Helianthus annuus]KAJ0799302.1 hypothetical protein HanOQP8_Chr00c740g0852151 [Helianthus annuus]
MIMSKYINILLKDKISRGLPNFTDGMDESLASSKCVKDPSRT